MSESATGSSRLWRLDIESSLFGDDSDDDSYDTERLDYILYRDEMCDNMICDIIEEIRCRYSSGMIKLMKDKTFLQDCYIKVYLENTAFRSSEQRRLTFRLTNHFCEHFLDTTPDAWVIDCAPRQPSTIGGACRRRIVHDYSLILQFVHHSLAVCEAFVIQRFMRRFIANRSHFGGSAHELYYDLEAYRIFERKVLIMEFRKIHDWFIASFIPELIDESRSKKVGVEIPKILTRIWQNIRNYTFRRISLFATWQFFEQGNAVFDTNVYGALLSEFFIVGLSRDVICHEINHIKQRILYEEYRPKKERPSRSIDEENCSICRSSLTTALPNNCNCESPTFTCHCCSHHDPMFFMEAQQRMRQTRSRKRKFSSTNEHPPSTVDDSICNFFNFEKIYAPFVYVSRNTVSLPITLTLRCGHRFHTPCIFRWFTNQCVCPMCRDPQTYDG